jgi:hypothetical protein
LGQFATIITIVIITIVIITIVIKTLFYPWRNSLGQFATKSLRFIPFSEIYRSTISAKRIFILPISSRLFLINKSILHGWTSLRQSTGTAVPSTPMAAAPLQSNLIATQNDDDLEEAFECSCSSDDRHCFSYDNDRCPCRISYEETHGYFSFFTWYPGRPDPGEKIEKWRFQKFNHWFAFSERNPPNPMST